MTELKNKIIQQLRFHRISCLDEDKTAFFIMNLLEEYRTQCDELPGDDVVNKQAKVSCKGNSHAMRYHHMLEQFREGAKWMRSLASPAIASRDARIRELEKALRSIEIGADPRNEYQAFSWIDTARSIANKVLTPPTQAEG
jgi:hypothetical protein